MELVTVKVVEDSVSKVGARLTTLECVYPRIPVHEQVLTHRAFSRNASSSRAIGVQRMIDSVTTNTVVPFEPRYEEKGMQGYQKLEGEDLAWFTQRWFEARDEMVRAAQEMTARRVHKQTVNRLLQPFQLITVVITATEWNNFLRLRLGHDAQPEIQLFALAVQRALRDSTPIEREKHLPFLLEEERDLVEAMMFSAARCARVSYARHYMSAKGYIEESEFANRLWKNGHLSPFEHSAVASGDPLWRGANFVGWSSARTLGGR